LIRGIGKTYLAGLAVEIDDWKKQNGR
jgi:hypothetical protein